MGVDEIDLNRRVRSFAFPIEKWRTNDGVVFYSIENGSVFIVSISSRSMTTKTDYFDSNSLYLSKRLAGWLKGFDTLMRNNVRGQVGVSQIQMGTIVERHRLEKKKGRHETEDLRWHKENKQK